MDDDLRRVEDAARQHGLSPETLSSDVLHDRDDDVFTNPGKYGLSATDVTRYQNAVWTNQGLDHDKGTDPDRPRPVMLWAYDPLAFNGKGRAAIAIGNPDKTQNTAVVVPGTNSSMKGGWLCDGQNDAINLYDQSLKADPNHSTAVLAWMGYDAPNSTSALGPGRHGSLQAATGRHALDGAPGRCGAGRRCQRSCGHP